MLRCAYTRILGSLTSGSQAACLQTANRTLTTDSWASSSGQDQMHPLSFPQHGVPPAEIGDPMHGDEPQLCAVPKRKLSLHRRGQRRVWYQLKRKPEVALCSFCGMVAARGTLFAGNPSCTGQCLGPSNKQYPEEYRQPC